MHVFTGKPSFAVRIWLIDVKNGTHETDIFLKKTFKIRAVLFICAHGDWFSKFYNFLYCTIYFLIFFSLALLVIHNLWLRFCFNAKPHKRLSYHSTLFWMYAGKNFSLIIKLAVIEHNIAVVLRGCLQWWFFSRVNSVSLGNNTRKRWQWYSFSLLLTIL